MQFLAKAEPNCLYLWDPDIVSCFAGDNHIRKVQPKTLLVINKLSMHSLGLPAYKRCSNYNVWKNLHHLEYKELCHKSNTLERSVYVPGKSIVVIKGNSAVIEGRIKSLDAPCLGKASSVNNHPYTFENCWKQRIDLINLINKRENAKLTN